MVASEQFSILWCVTVPRCAVVAAGPAWRQPIIIDELNRGIKDGLRATTLSVLSSLGTLVGIALNPLIGGAGDLGLNTTGLCLGGGLAQVGFFGKERSCP